MLPAAPTAAPKALNPNPPWPLRDSLSRALEARVCVGSGGKSDEEVIEGFNRPCPDRSRNPSCVDAKELLRLNDRLKELLPRKPSSRRATSKKGCLNVANSHSKVPMAKASLAKEGSWFPTTSSGEAQPTVPKRMFASNGLADSGVGADGGGERDDACCCCCCWCCPPVGLVFFSDGERNPNMAHFTSPALTSDSPSERRDTSNALFAAKRPSSLLSSAAAEAFVVAPGKESRHPPIQLLPRPPPSTKALPSAAAPFLRRVSDVEPLLLPLSEDGRKPLLFRCRPPLLCALPLPSPLPGVAPERRLKAAPEGLMIVEEEGVPVDDADAEGCRAASRTSPKSAILATQLASSSTLAD